MTLLNEPETVSDVASCTPAQPALRDLDIVVIGINYAPEGTGIGPYTTGIAEHLHDTAKSVTVLAGIPHYPAWTVEEYYRHALRFRERGTGGHPDVVRLRHHVPRRQSSTTRAAYEGTFLANAVTTPLAYPPDLVVAVTPSLGGAVAGATLAARHGAPLVIVVQDLMGKAVLQSGIPGGRTVSGVTSSLERWALRRADAVAVVTDAFRPTVRGYGIPDERIHLLPNWTHITASPRDTRSARAALGWPQDTFLVAHTGNMGLKQDLGNVVEAAALLGPDVDVVLVGDGNQRSAVRARAAIAAPHVRFVDPLDDDRYPLALAAADVLLVNERPTVADMSLPSKLTSYFAAGRPVVAAVSADGATAAELAQADGAALVVPPGDPAALADVLRHLRGASGHRRTMADASRTYAASSLGRDRTVARLDAVVEAALRHRAGRTSGRVTRLRPGKPEASGIRETA